MTRQDLAAQITNKLYESMRGRQIIILGGPQSGKTRMLTELRQKIEQVNRLWLVYGPVPAQSLLSPMFYSTLLHWLQHEGVLEAQTDPTDIPTSLLDFWQEVSPFLNKNLVRRIVILVDDANLDELGETDLVARFSAVRGFHEEWTDVDLTVHFVWAGTALASRLTELYKGSDRASWPFVRDHTLYLLPDLTVSEVYAWLVGTAKHTPQRLIHAEYLHEMTQGSVACLSAILQHLGESPINCAGLLRAAESLFADQQWIDTIRSHIVNLSDNARQQLGVLLNGQFLSVRQFCVLEDELNIFGLVRVDKVDELRLLRLHNWLIECTLRRHWNVFQPIVGSDVFRDDSELLPPTQVIDRGAFALLTEIESLLRNIVVVRLTGQQGKAHPFVGLNLEVKRRGPIGDPEYEDQYTRSTKWKKSVGNSRFVDTHGALISYTDIKDLLGLLDHLFSVNDHVTEPLRWIRPKLNGFKEIRDAVMHGQIITEESLDNLIEIRQDLYERLSVSV